MLRKTVWIIALASAIAVPTLHIGYYAAAAPGGGKTAVAADKPFKLEPVPGTKLKRVTLIGKAAERLGIETATVREQEIASKRWVPGTLVNPRAGSAEPVNASSSTDETTGALGEVLVYVPLASELEGVPADRQVYVLPVTGARAAARGKRVPTLLAAKPTNAPATEAAKGFYFALDRTDHGLTDGQRVSVQFTTNGSGSKRLVVPYSAVIYDEHGKAWVFTNPTPLTFVRAEIVVEDVEGDLAVLSKGPPPGTKIVSVGGMLLLGAEILNK
jgi:hypothetical protein